LPVPRPRNNKKNNSHLVDLSRLGDGTDPLNLAKAEKKYKHPGVAAHPSDYGMKNIADALYATVNKIIKK